MYLDANAAEPSGLAAGDKRDEFKWDAVTDTVALWDVCLNGLFSCQLDGVPGNKRAGPHLSSVHLLKYYEDIKGFHLSFNVWPRHCEIKKSE